MLFCNWLCHYVFTPYLLNAILLQKFAKFKIKLLNLLVSLFVSLRMVAENLVTDRQTDKQTNQVP